ncbi:MAG: hypothetical protein US89_C0012G0032 [Candidatus Peregrinibacteria bacterium GW2011_GWF2_38_29]|jgi:hypothetical protein|nr:MAG: hypothetical protein US89_C0012G0032 [Candidatus Peregrinibacteria bacterium GW2011_GWF2_38_29]
MLKNHLDKFEQVLKKMAALKKIENNKKAVNLKRTNKTQK